MKSLSCGWLFATPWTVAYQNPPSMWFSRQDTGVGCHFLLQEIILTQGLNPGLLHCRQILYHLNHQGSLFIHSHNWVFLRPWGESESEVAQSCPTLCDLMDCSLRGSSVHGIFQARVLEWVAASFSRGSSDPGVKFAISCVSCIAGGFLIRWAIGEALSMRVCALSRILGH